MGRHSVAFCTNNNRMTGDGDAERLCRRCDRWKHIDEFKKSHGTPGYTCRGCERSLQRHRDALKPKRIQGVPRLPQPFSDERVSISGLFKFSTMPTPAQLLERAA